MRHEARTMIIYIVVLDDGTLKVYFPEEADIILGTFTNRDKRIPSPKSIRFIYLRPAV